MYCKHCGKEIDESAAFCPHCGAHLKEAPKKEQEKDEFFDAAPAPAPAHVQQTYTQPTKTNTLAIVGFVLSFFVALAGLICSIVGLQQCNKTNEGGKGLAIAGIVISAASMFLGLIVSIVLAPYLSAYFEAIFS